MILQSIFIALGILATDPSEELVTLNVTSTNSTITWTGSKVGGSHTGTIDVKSGQLKVDNGVLKGGEFVIDMTTIKNTDLTGEYQGKLEGHLKSDDFFGVEKFPQAKLVLTSVVPQGGENYKVTADLTIKGITKEIKFPATLTQKGNGYTASASLTVDRSEYNVRYGSGSFFDDLGDKVIYDDFQLEVTISID